MESKEAIFTDRMDPGTVGRAAMGGAMVGGGATAVLSLIHMLRSMKQRQETEQAEDEEGTITLTLPPKAAKSCDPVKLVKVESPKVTSVTGPKKQFRHAIDGKFGNKTAAEPGKWQTLSGKWLAGGAGAAGGAYVVNKVYQKIRERKLEQELEAAQQEYMDLLQRGSASKLATSMDSLFPMGKDAADKWGLLSYPLASAAVLTVLGTGATAWMTKKVLDEKLRGAKGRGLDLPQLQRIVFKTAPQPVAAPTALVGEEEEEPGYKQATAEDIVDVQAALGIMMDKVGSHTLVLDTDYVQAEMVKAGTDVRGMFKLAQDIDALMNYLRQNPQLSRMVQRATMEKHPVMKHFRWATKIPGLNRIGDWFANRKINNYFRPKPQAQPAASGPSAWLAKLKQRFTPEPPSMMDNIKQRFTPQPPGMAEQAKQKALEFQQAGAKRMQDFRQYMSTPQKQAGLGSDVFGSILGSAAVESTLGHKGKAAPVAPEPASASPAVKDIELEAQDPGAQEYLDNNRQRVLAILTQMRQEGKI